MAGYRQHSYDPNTYERPGKPLRPYNWVQWVGVVICSLGAIGCLLYIANEIGLIDLGLKEPGPFIALPMIGIFLVNSRREAGTPMTGEQIERQRKIAFIVLGAALVAGAIGFAVAYSSKGAH
jgi:amino acid transporter